MQAGWVYATCWGTRIGKVEVRPPEGLAKQDLSWILLLSLYLGPLRLHPWVWGPTFQGALRESKRPVRSVRKEPLRGNCILRGRSRNPLNLD